LDAILEENYQSALKMANADGLAARIPNSFFSFEELRFEEVASPVVSCFLEND
jgi:hypothetical protein